MKKDYYYFVDILRWLSATAVIFYHYSAHFQIEEINDSRFFNFIINNSPYGAYGVWVFWMISGFVFTNIYINTESNLSEFFVKRFARLYPLHFATLIIVALLQLYSFKQFDHLQMYAFQDSPELHYNDLYRFIKNLFFINNGHSYNVVTWSVSIEIPVYFIFFYFIKYNTNNFFLKSLFLVFLLWLNLRFNFLYYHLTMCLFYFFFGALIYLICNSLKKFNIYLLLFSIIGILSIPFMHELKNIIFLAQIKKFIPTNLLFYLSLLILFFSLEKYLHNVGKKIKFLGDSSYAIYMIHFPIQIIVLILIDHQFIDLETLKSYKFLIAFLIFTNLIAYPIFKLFETPMRKKITRYFKY